MDMKKKFNSRSQKLEFEKLTTKNTLALLIDLYSKTILKEQFIF